MKFITITIAALNLGYNAVATPMPSAALKTSPLVIEAPLLDTVVDLEESLASELAPGVARSAPEFLSKRSVITIITGAISALETSVTFDLTDLTVAIAKDVTTNVVPTVEASLANIVTALNNTVLIIVPAVTGTVTRLTIDEVEALITTLGDLQSTVSSIESTFASLATTASADALKMLQPEFSAVLTLILPLVSPITLFATSVAGTIIGDEGTLSELVTAVSGLTTAVQALLNPVTGAIASIL